MHASTQRAAVLGLLAVMMVATSGCGIELVFDRTPTYKVVGWKLQVDIIETEKREARAADRQIFVMRLDQDLQVVDGTQAFDVDYGSNGFEPVPIDTNVVQTYKDQIEAKMIAERHYNPAAEHLLFFQTTNLEDFDGADRFKVTADVEDISTNGHGIDPGDPLGIAGVTQSDLDDGGDLDSYGIVEHAIVPLPGAIFDADEDNDIDLQDYAAFQRTLGRQEFLEVFTGPRVRHQQIPKALQRAAP